MAGPVTFAMLRPCLLCALGAIYQARATSESAQLQSLQTETVDSKGKVARMMRSVSVVEEEEAEDLSIKEVKTTATNVSNGLTGSCQFTEWDDWSVCTKTCGGGITERSRTLLKGDNLLNEIFCDGPTRDVQACSGTACDEDCQFSQWSEWSECSVTCGNGASRRTRNFSQAPFSLPDRKCLQGLMETRPCHGSCSAQSSDFGGNDKALLTGGMQFEVQNPEDFCETAGVKDILSSAVATFAMHPVENVTIALMPGVLVGESPRTVNMWFSMRVPRSVIPRDVVQWVNKSKRDLPQTTRDIQAMLQLGGVSAVINVTRFTVTQMRQEVITLPPKPTPPPVVDWQQNNTLRLTGLLKVGLPCHATQFAMDSQVKNASEMTLSEVIRRFTNVQLQGVRASAIPGQVMHANVDTAENGLADSNASSSLAKINSTGEVDTWFRVLGAQFSTRQEAIRQSKAACESLLKVSLTEISSVLASHTNGTDTCWLAPKVIFLSCRAEDEDPCPAVPQPVTGLMELKVRAPRTFAADHRAEEAAQETIADLAGANLINVRVNILPEKSETTIVLPVVPATALLEIGSAHDAMNVSAQEETVFAWFYISASAKGETPEKMVARLLGAEMAYVGLKLQHSLIKAGLDYLVDVSTLTAEVYNASTSVLKPWTSTLPITTTSTPPNASAAMAELHDDGHGS